MSEVIDYKGRSYTDINAMCSAYNISVTTFLRRLGRGMTKRDALCVKGTQDRQYIKAGMRLKEERLICGFKQRDIARFTHVCVSQVSAWESGRELPARKKIEDLSILFGCGCDYLTGHTDDRFGVVFSPKRQEEKKNKESQKTRQNEDDALFAMRLRSARKNANLRQSDLAEAVGKNTTYISMYERSRAYPDNKTMSAIAETLNVSVGYLKGDK